MAVLGADGHLELIASQARAHAAHVHAEGLRDPGGHAGGRAVAHLLEYGDMVPHPAVQAPVPRRGLLGLGQQNGYGELVVQEPALDESGGGHHGPGIKADNVPGHDPQGLHVRRGADLLVNDHLHIVIAAAGVVVLGVDVDGGVFQLEGAGVGLPGPGDDAHILRLPVVGVHAPQVGQMQPPGGGDLLHHAAQGVQMSLQQNTVRLWRVRIQAHQHAALYRHLRPVAHLTVSGHHPLRRVFCVARGAVHPQQVHGLLHGEIH